MQRNRLLDTMLGGNREVGSRASLPSGSGAASLPCMKWVVAAGGDTRWWAERQRTSISCASMLLSRVRQSMRSIIMRTARTVAGRRFALGNGVAGASGDAAAALITSSLKSSGDVYPGRLGGSVRSLSGALAVRGWVLYKTR